MTKPQATCSCGQELTQYIEHHAALPGGKLWWAFYCSNCPSYTRRYWSRCPTCFELVEIEDPFDRLGPLVSVPLSGHQCAGAMTAWLCARPRWAALEWHGRCGRLLQVEQLPLIPNLLWWHPTRGVVRVMECGRMLEAADGEWLEMCSRMAPAHIRWPGQRPGLAAMRLHLLDYELLTVRWQWWEMPPAPPSALPPWADSPLWKSVAEGRQILSGAAR